MFRISYVKYSTGANITTCVVCRAMRKPNSTVARRAFCLRKEKRQHAQRNDTPFCASALFRVLRLFFAYFFLARQKWDQTANQRSVCCLERTSSGMDETCRLRRGEGYGACEDELPEAQLRSHRKKALRCNRRSSAPSARSGGQGRPPLQVCANRQKSSAPLARLAPSRAQKRCHPFRGDKFASFGRG